MQTATTSATPTIAARPAGAAGRFPLTFVLAAFGFSWACWLPLVLAARGLLPLPVPTLAVVLVGSFGPTLAAVAVTAREAGRAGVRALAGRLLRWRVAPGWYAVALGLPFLLSLLAMGLHVALGGAPPSVAGLVALLPLLPVQFLFALPFGPLGEEVGWRGYALPALQARYGALAASALLGVVWACWHLPLFFVPGLPHSRTPFLLVLLGTLPLTVVFTWVVNSTRGSLLLAILLHAASNLSGDIWAAVPDVAGAAEPPLAYIAGLGLPVGWALAAAVVLLTDPRTLARRRGRARG